MAAYVVISEHPDAFGKGDTLAVVVDDGTETIVVGTSDLADSLREEDAVSGEDPVRRLQAFCSGLSYFSISGPLVIEGSAADSAAVLDQLYLAD